VLHAFGKSAVVALLLTCGFASGCQNYRDQLQRGQGYYEQNQYEAALAVFRNLERDQSALGESEVVRYCYLRGMTDYRLGYPDHARYWLGLAKAANVEGSMALLADEEARLNSTLSELNEEVYGIKEASAEANETSTGESACSDALPCAAGSECKDGACVSVK
jgi:hypothetical protein